jgi:hypothetical protein
MVDEQLAEIPEMAQKCPWDGKPVPQPLNNIVSQYGALQDVEVGDIFESLAAIQKAGAHSHVGYHGSATQGWPVGFPNAVFGATNLKDSHTV